MSLSAAEDPAGATTRYMIDSVSIPRVVTKYADDEKKKGK